MMLCTACRSVYEFRLVISNVCTMRCRWVDPDTLDLDSEERARIERAVNYQTRRPY